MGIKSLFSPEQKGEDIYKLSNRFIRQGIFIFAILTLISSIIKFVVFKLDFIHSFDLLLIMVAIGAYVLFRHIKSGIATLTKQKYTKGKVIFLLVGSIFHGGMIFGFKAMKGSLATTEGILQTIKSGAFASMFWGGTFHLISMHKVKIKSCFKSRDV